VPLGWPVLLDPSATRGRQGQRDVWVCRGRQVPLVERATLDKQGQLGLLERAECLVPLALEQLVQWVPQVCRDS